jgi:hypothetical protein
MQVQYVSMPNDEVTAIPGISPMSRVPEPEDNCPMQTHKQNDSETSGKHCHFDSEEHVLSAVLQQKTHLIGIIIQNLGVQRGRDHACKVTASSGQCDPDSMPGNLFGYVATRQKEQTLRLRPNRMLISVTATASPVCSQRVISFGPSKRQERDDAEIDNVS